MTASKAVSSATLLPDGRALLIEFQNAELYDPSPETVTPTGSMVDGQGGRATLLTNGKALITGSGNPQLTTHRRLLPTSRAIRAEQRRRARTWRMLLKNIRYEVDIYN